MQHEQQDSLTRSSLPLLLPVLLLSLAAPWLIAFYESRQDYQWEQMLGQQWQPPVEPLALPATSTEQALEQGVPGMASADTPEWQLLEPVPEAPEESPLADPPPAEPAPPAATAPVAAPEQPQDEQRTAAARKAAVPPQVAQPKAKADNKAPAKPKPKSLKLKLPENPYHGEVAKWQEEPPLPDLFAPKPAPPSRLELGGRLITDDEVQKKNPEADFIDTVKGAEINITVKTN